MEVLALPPSPPSPLSQLVWTKGGAMRVSAPRQRQQGRRAGHSRLAHFVAFPLPRQV